METPKVLFFTATATPTYEERLEAESYMPCRIMFRNNKMVPEHGALEGCDAVAGIVPRRYSLKYPHAEAAVEAFVDARKLARDNLKRSQSTQQKVNLEVLKNQAKAVAGKAKKAKDAADKTYANAEHQAEARTKAAANWKPNT